jgi:hypothetical protein
VPEGGVADIQKIRGMISSRSNVTVFADARRLSDVRAGRAVVEIAGVGRSG